MQTKYKTEIELMENQIKLIPELIRRGYKAGIEKNKIIKKIDKAFIFGIGASWLAGKAFLDLFRNQLKKPVWISREAINFLTSKDLALFITYSGKTKETLDAFRKIKNKTNNLLFLTSNPKLKPAIQIDRGLLSRTAFPFKLAALIGLFKDFINFKTKEIEKIKKIEKKEKEIKNKARILANYIWLNYRKKIIFISDLGAIALRLKNQLNENAKLTLAIATLPEAYHNEIEAKHDGIILYACPTPRLKKFIEIKKKECKLLIVEPKFESEFLNFIYVLMLVDWMSLYLAIKNKVNPLEIQKITQIKSI